jgi:hypothetical protein
MVALLAGAFFGSTAWVDTARGEAWPDLHEFVPKCSLIVHLRSTDRFREPDRVGTRCSVVEVIKGEYRPQNFESPPQDGFIDLWTMYSGGSDEQPLDLIAFYAHNSINAQGRLLQPDMVLCARAGEVRYPPEGELVESKAMPLADFLRHIKAIASDVPADVTAVQATQALPATSWLDMSGSWRVFLPAGFEQPVTMTRLGGDRYRLEPSSLTFSGTYELRDAELVLVESAEASEGGFRWHMHSEHLLALVEQNHSCGSTYVGAAMFRARQSE